MIMHTLNHIKNIINANCVTDVEECALEIHNCSQMCVELIGGYECDCHHCLKVLSLLIC